METGNDREWAAISRIIRDDKARAWEEMDPHVRPNVPSMPARRRVIPPGLAAAAAVLLAAVGLLFWTLPGKKPVTLDQLPFFASAGQSIAHGKPSPREREMGRRLAGWINIVNREKAAGGPDIINSDQSYEDKDISNRETMLERLFLESTQHQEV